MSNLPVLEGADLGPHLVTGDVPCEPKVPPPLPIFDLQWLGGVIMELILLFRSFGE